MIGFIGLGKMGTNLVLNLHDKKQRVVTYNRSPGPTQALIRKGVMGMFSLRDLTLVLTPPRTLWLMVTAGQPVDDLISQLVPLLSKGDTIIDGGNSYYKDSMRRSKALKAKGIHFLDVGVSGGISGARNGACLMIGGDVHLFKKHEKLFKALSVPNGYAYLGSSGAGHYVKMMHNAIEYGMLASLAEGMQALEKNKKKFGLHLETIASVYAHGSIIEGKLTSWLLDAMKNDPGLKATPGKVPLGGTEEEMKKLEAEEHMPILHEARVQRTQSRKKPSFAGKVVTSVRHEFGGHDVK